MDRFPFADTPAMHDVELLPSKEKRRLWSERIRSGHYVIGEEEGLNIYSPNRHGNTNVLTHGSLNGTLRNVFDTSPRRDAFS